MVNPLIRWQETLREARALLDGDQHRPAELLLQQALEDARNLRGTTVDDYLPLTLAYLGEARFAMGQMEKAQEPLESALMLYERKQDAAGASAALRSLIELHRYAGEMGRAVERALALAACHVGAGRVDEAAEVRARAERLRGGEPLCRVVAELEGKTYELDEVPAGSGGVRFRFERNRVTLPGAGALTRRGERLAQAKRPTEALAAFSEAALLDPHDPHARYLQALTLMELRRYAAAVSAYDATEQLAPGWFHCRADRWLASEFAAGRVEHSIWDEIRALEDGPEDVAAKCARAERALMQAPQLALLHLIYGRQLAALGKPGEAGRAFETGLSAAGERDVRTRLLLELAVVTRDRAASWRLLEEAVALGGNLVACAKARLLQGSTLG